jgi:hypothetical protein
MTPILLAIIATLSVLGLAAGVISLVVQWKNITGVVDVSALRTELSQLQVAQLDMLDKVEAWIKRDRVRRAREPEQPSTIEGAMEKLSEDPKAKKAALRRQAFNMGIVK